MSTNNKHSFLEKKELIKTVLRELHQGLSPDTAAARIMEEAGYLTAAEIASIEEELLAEGIPAAEIQQFCNVHALMF
ncbi:MAG TPA: DUF438 domain-containing protein, partial [Spirochaetia bacterium]|nr:DUF438 domain-containing protein [Spirochaetia bacterium]